MFMFQVNSSFLRGPYKKIVGRESLETTILGLTFKVQPHHFKGGDMKLKCLATISSIYWKSNEESVEGEKQPKPPVLEIKRTNEMDDDKSRADRVQGWYYDWKIEISFSIAEYIVKLKY